MNFILIFTLFQPQQVEPLCVEAVELYQGDQAPCSGILWGIEDSREAVVCKSVDLPHLRSLLDYTKKVSEAKVDALIARALSAEKALKLIPEPVSTSAVIVGAAAVLAVGFLGGFALGVIN